MSIFAALDAVVGVAHSAIEGLATLLTPTTGDLAAAAAIVGFTILVRLLVSPLSWLQARSAKRGAALAPEIAKLREKHRDDPAALATETLALQRANGAGPGKSLLTALVQAPFFMIMYRLVQPGSGEPSGLLAGKLFGVPLTAHLTTGLPVFAALLALATGLAIWSSRRARRSLAPPEPRTDPPAVGRKPAGKAAAVATTARAGAAARKAATANAGSAARKPTAAKTGSAAGKPATASAGSAARQPATANAGSAARKAATASAGSAARKPTAAKTGSAARKPAAGKAARAAAGPSAAETAAPLVGRLMTFLPYATILMVAYLPLAGALYLVTSTAWTALEQALWRRPGRVSNR
jgi:YidC/Oxa1 family membrane protein insertase